MYPETPERPYRERQDDVRVGGERSPRAPARDDPRRLDGRDYSDRDFDDDRTRLWLAVGTGALLGAAGVAWWARRQMEEGRGHPPDTAPARTSRYRRDDGYVVAGRTVTIDKPRAEVYAFWRDFSNLPSFMENIDAVSSTGEGTHRWSITAFAGRSVEIDTRIVRETENETLAWQSIEGSAIESHGEVTFRDAPGGRGTEVAAVIAYRPLSGELGRLVAKLFQREPAVQVRRELKRLKMLLETGEIATSANRVSAA